MTYGGRTLTMHSVDDYLKLRAAMIADISGGSESGSGTSRSRVASFNKGT